MKRFPILKLIRRSKNRWQPLLALVVGVGIITAFFIIHERNLEEARLAAEAAARTANSTPRVNAFSSVRLTGQAAIVYDLTTGQTLFSRNADQALPLASLTKLLTIYAAADTLSPESTVTITQKALDQDGESGFTLGETFAFRDIARFSLVSSSNDAAEAIAEAAGMRRGMSDAQLLSAAAAAAGLERTTAANGTGLDESTTRAGAYGSARDMAKLAGALIRKAPAIAMASAAPSFSATSRDGVVHTLPNTNQNAIHVPGILLSKTGYTDLAGGNLVVVFDTGVAHPVAIAVLGSTREGRFADVEALVDATLVQFANTTL